MSGQRENILGGLVALLATMSLQLMTSSPRHKVLATEKPPAMIDADWYSLNATSLRTMTLYHHGVMPQVVVRATALERERSLVQVVLADNPYADLFRFDMFLDHNPYTGRFTVTPTHIDIDRHVVQDGMMWYVCAGNGDTIEYMHEGSKPVLLDVHRFLQAPDTLHTLWQANDHSKKHRHKHKKHHKKQDDDDDDDESYHTMHSYAKAEGRAYIWAVVVFITECMKNMLFAYAQKLAMDFCKVHKLDKRLMRRLARMSPFRSIASKSHPPIQPEEVANDDSALKSTMAYDPAIVEFTRHRPTQQEDTSSLVFGTMTYDQVIEELKSYDAQSMEFAFGSVMEDMRRKHKRAANQFKLDHPNEPTWTKMQVTGALRDAYTEIISVKQQPIVVPHLQEFPVLQEWCSILSSALTTEYSDRVPMRKSDVPVQRGESMERGGSKTKKKIRKQSITRRKPCASNWWFW